MTILVKDGGVLSQNVVLGGMNQRGSALWRLREKAQGSALHPVTLALDAVLIAVVLTAMRSPAALTIGALSLIPFGLVSGLYRRRTCIETQGVLWYVRALAVPVALAAGFAAIVPAGGDRVDALQAIGVAAGVLLFVRIGLWLDVSAARRRGVGMRRALVSGPGPAVQQLLRRMSAFPECGVEAVAVHTPSARPDQRSSDRGQGRPEGARYTRAVDLVASRAVDAVLVIASGSDRGSYDELVREGDGTGIEYNVVVPLAGLAGPFKPRIGDIGVVPIGQVNYTAGVMRGKRAFDMVSAAFALLFLAPLLGVLALLVKLGSRGPVFYGQRRVGLDGEEFKMWKFRSMVVGADTMVEQHAHENVNDGLLFKLENDPRITRVGKILRRLSLDELPQLFNVLKGDMSFVGPRPLPVDPDAFDDLAAKRHSVRPGITGPWQVHGGHALSYDDMVGLDLAYINGWTFRHDLWILLLTVPALLVRRAPVI
ncbi:MAG: exopolysaccharide biosynthesis polyprenyl glycosylphosphotransferase [Actinobacteria bacterium]|nr:exopolysaccharide biosynthesis polyprenyl glycosylphosphotransferase [Actinomycetota bacterium]